MGKDRSGTFHPGKGKPSGVNKEEGLGVSNTDPEKMDQYLELTDRYTDNNENLQGVNVRHPNRNTSKGENNYKGRENKKGGDKTINKSTGDEANAIAGEPVDDVIEQLPSILTKDLFAEMAAYRSEPCVSVYLPTHAAGMEVNEGFDEIAFKNVLQEIEKTLLEKGINAVDVGDLLKPGYTLLRDEKFWASLSRGLAVFIAHDYFRYIKMQVAPEKSIFCNTSFRISPLIPLLLSPECFFLLVISKQKAKLFRGDRFGLQFIPVDGLPEDITDVTGIAERNSSTWRMGSHGGTGGANFHGMGGELDHKTEIANYLEAVDDVFYKKVLNRENAPLLLAGVEYLIPIYRSVCDYHNVYPEALTGSFENEPTPKLHAEAMKVMKPFFDQRKNRAKELFADNIATPLTASLNEQVIPASYYGRVSYLFVRNGAQLWGLFDEMNNKLVLHGAEQGDSEDLVDRTVQKTLLNGGEVFLVEQPEMPSEGEMAAVLRY